MGNINDNIRSKKLYESGNVTAAHKDSEGKTVVPASIAAELDAIDSVAEVMNDAGIFHVNKHLLKQVEDIRLDVEDVHGFISEAFGKDASQAASQGAQGAQGAQGPRGAAGSNGTNGAKGDQGIQGVKGDQGAQGVKGNTGATGSIGPKGSNGSNGSQGIQGIQGSTGPTGATGATGPTLNVTNNSNNRVITATGGTTVNAESSLTFDGTTTSSPSMSVNRYFQAASGIPTNNLGSPTVTEMALFEGQFTNKTGLNNGYDNLADLTFWIQPTSSSSWTEVTSYSDDQKRRFLRTNNSGVIIPAGTYKFRVEFRGQHYTFANAMYAYWSSNSHSTTAHIWKKRCSDGAWLQHTSSTTRVSSWPGHMYLPFSTIPWHETNTSSTGHYTDVRVEFQPSWSTGSYSTRSINLSGMQIWGGYPSGRRTQHYYDQNGTLQITKDENVQGSLFSNGTEVIRNGAWVGSNSGLVGATGATGPQGNAGSNGTNGAKGDQGIQGLKGNTGAQGGTGAKGNTGSTGPQGIQGVIGLTGSAGSNGTNGTNGTNGAKGNTGATGPQGPAGAKGNTGSAGAAGAAGATGPRGLTGAAGSNGSNGSQGIQGIRGLTGAAGTNGAKGDAGAVGAAGAKGSTGSQGPTGPAGAKGATGSAGSNGSQGIQGIQGLTGAAGSNGAKGDTGAAGATGSAGPAGPRGLTGAAGSNGSNGSQGAKGDTGSQGATGPAGSTSYSAGNLTSIGYGSSNLTWRQGTSNFGGHSGWASNIISNHGNGSNYYNQMITLPFWGPPSYSRLEGGNQKGPWVFLTEENYGNYISGFTGTQTVVVDAKGSTRIFDYQNGLLKGIK